MNLSQRQTGKINVTRFCYSNGLGGEIKRLSIENILKDFANNVEFCNSIKSNFTFNTELVEIDEYSKEYKALALIKKYITTNIINQ